MLPIILEYGAPIFCASGCIFIHKVAIGQVSSRFTVRSHHGRANALIRALVVLLLSHLLQISVFAMGMIALDTWIPGASLKGDIDGSFDDYLYFSGTTYSSLGFGDIVPTGGLRLLIAVEALVGLIMIAWTAAFLFSEEESLNR